jgi:hypothetical protein
MVTKTMRQSSRMHNRRKTRASIKITPNRWETVTTTLGTTRKYSLWQRIINWFKSLVGQAKAV